MINYPIKFTPILKDKIWGGEKLKTVLNKETSLNNVGESWELSSVDGDISVVANGVLKGKKLTELLETYQEQLVGQKVYGEFGNKFPLLFKFIDAKENLSIQLHPNDEIAKKLHNSFGKTEMWFVMDADKNSELNIGFSEAMNPEKYKQAVEDKKILDKLNFEKVTKGDSFFIKEGLVHAIGAGCLIAEIQQTSDITYRIYDWDRVDDQGNERELHTELALEALDYDAVGANKCKYDEEVNQPSNIASCEYFTTNYVKVNNLFTRDLSEVQSFAVYICVGGQGTIEINGNTEEIKRGETVLIPANTQELVVKSEGIELLEVYIKS
ncbi:mannose-6-phosphate isomerase [Wenyingzhuangia fucanilytica]|uniref:Phosphohexomutase n=1 Tax=Wenyingzhuangia fucanilytica TaxID=1790137 RepID=A0A1B1Y2G9_9FLAO|nr:type I phosphomannose isomerase catalytic subunit [Wenyingzhuangia fucanilytica]ANW94962.1 mannose-6-phosphate isomerase [Wenyingzhuangia fucanilytica]